jgi:hypothetical protein
MRIVPVEANLAGLVLQFERAGEGGKRHRDSGERALPANFAALGLFLRLDAFPRFFDGLRR